MADIFEDMTLRVLPGDGLVHRGPGTVLVVPSVGPGRAEAAMAVLGLCQGPADPTGRRLVRRVAALLADVDPDTVPPLALLVDTGTDLVVVAHGDVEVVVSGDQEQLVRGAGSLAWVERRVAGTVKELVATDGSRGEEPSTDLPFHLERGTVPGGGLVLTKGPALQPVVLETAAPAAEPAPARASAGPSEPAGFDSVLLVDVPASAHHNPLPVAVEREVEPEAGEDLVEGALCSRGHFNDPHAPYCSVCGISMLQRTRATVVRARPSLGVLVLDDGSAYTVSAPYVLGRNPETDDAVAAGAAHPLALDDAAHSVSRVHAEITLDGWDVLLTDRGSSNGTYVSETGQDGSWSAVPAGTPTRLGTRTHIRLGRRRLVFDSYHGAGAPTS